MKLFYGWVAVVAVALTLSLSPVHADPIPGPTWAETTQVVCAMDAEMHSQVGYHDATAAFELMPDGSEWSAFRQGIYMVWATIYDEESQHYPTLVEIFEKASERFMWWLTGTCIFYQQGPPS